MGAQKLNQGCPNIKFIYLKMSKNIYKYCVLSPMIKPVEKNNLDLEEGNIIVHRTPCKIFLTKSFPFLMSNRPKTSDRL